MVIKKDFYTIRDIMRLRGTKKAAVHQWLKRHKIQTERLANIVVVDKESYHEAR